jgi:hypothetical protein
MPADSPGSITCVSNAAPSHRVTLTLPWGAAHFNGAGDELMKSDEDGLTYMLPAQDAPYEIVALFELAPPERPYQPASVSAPVVTEQDSFVEVAVSASDDPNGTSQDTLLTITTVSPGGASEPESRPKDSGEPAEERLEVHAKTYYTGFDWGDEHFITVEQFSEDDSPVRWGGTGGWTLLRSGCHDQKTTVGGYYNIFVELGDSEHAEMHSARLKLLTSIGYWFTPPRGHYGSQTWEGYLTGTPLMLTRVTA